MTLAVPVHSVRHINPPPNHIQAVCQLHDQVVIDLLDEGIRHLTSRDFLTNGSESAYQHILVIVVVASGFDRLSDSNLQELYFTVFTLNIVFGNKESEAFNQTLLGIEVLSINEKQDSINGLLETGIFQLVFINHTA